MGKDVPMNCRGLTSLLMEYLEGGLSIATRRDLEDHRGQCPPCACFVDSYLTTVLLVRRSYEIEEDPP
jgi:hypothetical protein